MEITLTIEKYLEGITSDEFHRYKSWDHCHQSFSSSTQTDYHVLELAFYLASWGMYRGSSGLLKKNHLIHKGAVDILFSHEGQKLKCNPENEVTNSNIKEILYLKDKLTKHYGSINYQKSLDEQKTISTTDTLISKVLLGTLGCVPAYDRYFIIGLKQKNMKYQNFNEASLVELFDFINDNISETEKMQKDIFNKTKKHYPIMKIVDMYFWQLGYEQKLREKQ